MGAKVQAVCGFLAIKPYKFLNKVQDLAHLHIKFGVDTAFGNDPCLASGGGGKICRRRNR
jgi:hypothetical protein